MSFNLSSSVPISRAQRAANPSVLPPQPLLAYTIRVVELLAKIPGGVVVGSMDGLPVMAFYAALAALALGLYRHEFFHRWLRPPALIVGAALLAGATWRASPPSSSARPTSRARASPIGLPIIQRRYCGRR